MKYYQKWAEFGKIWGKTSKNVKNEVKIQKLVFSNFSKIISREIREKNYFEFLEKFSRRTPSRPRARRIGSLVIKAMTKENCMSLFVVHLNPLDERPLFTTSYHLSCLHYLYPLHLVSWPVHLLEDRLSSA
jgi:hypothetical protein